MNLPQGRAFCDTSFLFASLCPDDSNFEKAGYLLEYCVDNSVTLYTTWDIISESITLLRYRADYNTAVKFIELIKPVLSIVHYEDSVRRAAEEVFIKISKDKKLSYCDALSFVVVTQMLDNMPCLTFDKDFRKLGLTVCP